MDDRLQIAPGDIVVWRRGSDDRDYCSVFTKRPGTEGPNDFMRISTSNLWFVVTVIDCYDNPDDIVAMLLTPEGIAWSSIVLLKRVS